MADFTFLRRRALASRKPASRSRISASRPPCSPAFTMLTKSRSNTRGCFAIDSLKLSPPCTRVVTSLIMWRKLSGEENQVRFLDRPVFLAGVGCCGLLLERKHHKPAAHQAGYGIIFIK